MFDAVLQPEPAMTLSGTLRLSDSPKHCTAGMFSNLINDNAEVFKRYFGVALFPGSLNVDVPLPLSLQADLDAGNPAASLIVPRTALINMPAYIGDGQAWMCTLKGEKLPEPINCWIFRRKGSRVPKGVIEIVAPYPPLRPTYNLKHGDKVSISVLTSK